MGHRRQRGPARFLVDLEHISVEKKYILGPYDRRSLCAGVMKTVDSQRKITLCGIVFSIP